MNRDEVERWERERLYLASLSREELREELTRERATRHRYEAALRHAATLWCAYADEPEKKWGAPGCRCASCTAREALAAAQEGEGNA